MQDRRDFRATTIPNFAYSRNACMCIMYVCVHASMYVCRYVCMYVCMYVFMMCVIHVMYPASNVSNVSK